MVPTGTFANRSLDAAALSAFLGRDAGGYRAEVRSSSGTDGLRDYAVRVCWNEGCVEGAVRGPAPIAGVAGTPPATVAVGRGTLEVLVEGEAEGVAPDVSVTKTLRRVQAWGLSRLEGLPGGNYSVTALGIRNDRYTYEAPAVTGARLSSGEGARVQVRYQPTSGAISVSVAAPAEATVSAVLSGPSGNHTVRESALIPYLAPGAYSLAAPDIPCGEYVCEPRIEGAPVTLAAGTLYFQEEDSPPEQLAAIGTPGLRYIYRAGDGQTLYQDAVQLFQETGGTRYDLVGLSLNFQSQSGTGVREAGREISADLLFQADAGLGLRRLDCSPLAPPPVAAAGDWRINVEGLDPGVSALVGVTGPGGFNRTLTASATLNGLRQGTYSVTADAVAHPGLPFVRYRPTNPAEGSSLGVEVGGANLPVTSVRYTRIPGRLRVQVEGLPAGVTATLRAIGSFASSDFALGNGEQRFNLEAGRYTLEWPSLPDPGGQGNWLPDRNNFNVDVPSEGEGDAGTIRYTLEPNPYRLNLNVRLRGGGGTALTPRVCIQPRDTLPNPDISPDAIVPDCLFR